MSDETPGNRYPEGAQKFNLRIGGCATTACRADGWGADQLPRPLVRGSAAPGGDPRHDADPRELGAGGSPSVVTTVGHFATVFDTDFLASYCQIVSTVVTVSSL